MVAQLVEHRPFKPRVEGSIPSHPTNLLLKNSAKSALFFVFVNSFLRTSAELDP